MPANLQDHYTLFLEYGVRQDTTDLSRVRVYILHTPSLVYSDTTLNIFSTALRNKKVLADNYLAIPPGMHVIDLEAVPQHVDLILFPEIFHDPQR